VAHISLAFGMRVVHHHFEDDDLCGHQGDTGLGQAADCDDRRLWRTAPSHTGWPRVYCQARAAHGADRPKGFLANPSHRRPPRMHACPATRDWHFMVTPLLAAVFPANAVGRTAPASADAAQPTRPHGKKIFLIATRYPCACRPPASTPPQETPAPRPAHSTLARSGRGRPGRRPAEVRQIPPAHRCARLAAWPNVTGHALSAKRPAWGSPTRARLAAARLAASWTRSPRGWLERRQAACWPGQGASCRSCAGISSWSAASGGDSFWPGVAKSTPPG
jgi:hypothetical protein